MPNVSLQLFSSKREAIGWFSLLLVTLSAIIIPFLIFGESIETWTETRISGAHWLAIAMLATFLLAADVLLPVPSSIVSLAAGSALGVAVGTLVIWVGMTFGCACGWAVGRGLLRPMSNVFTPPPDDQKDISLWTLILCRPVPVLAELSVLMSSARGATFRRLMIACGAANLPVAALYAYFGARFLGEVPLYYLFVAVAVVMGIGWTLKRWRSKSV